MPLFSCFTPFGQLEFSSKPSVLQNIYQAMVNNLGGQYDLTVGGHNEATVYARARAIARAKQAGRRAGNQAYPLKCIELLPLQEAGFGLVPSETDTILTRQQALSARMLLARGATQENVETQLRALLGASFLGYRTLFPSEISTWPTDPTNGPGIFPRIDGVVSAKFVQFLEPVATIGTRKVHYAALDITQGPVVLTPGDVMTVQLEVLAQAEKVVVTTSGSDANGLFFTASFANAHDIGATGIVGSVPVWMSTQRFAFIEVLAAASISSETKRKVDDIMDRVARGVSQWALVQPTTPGANTIGPMTLGQSPLGAVTIGTVALTTPTIVPTLTMASPNLGDTSGGGQLVTLTGTSFTGATSVQFGGTAATSVTVVNHTTITCLPPAHLLGIVSVLVTTPNGTNTANTAFEYWTPAQVTGIDVYLDSNKGVVGGAAVNTWTDQSANARSFVQATGANKPAQTAAVFGTMPSIRFTPQQFLSLAAAIAFNTTGKSIFAAAKWTATTAVVPPPGNAGNVPLTIVGDRTNAYGSFGAIAGQMETNYYTGGPNLVDRGSGLNDGVVRMIGTTYDTTVNVQSYVGTVQQGATYSGGAIIGLDTYDTIGAGYPGSDGWNGDLGFVVIATGVISGGDLAKLNTWSQQRFGTP